VNYGFVCLLGWPPAAAASTLLVATDRFSGAEVDRVVDWVSSLAGKVVPACYARVGSGGCGFDFPRAVAYQVLIFLSSA